MEQFRGRGQGSGGGSGGGEQRGESLSRILRKANDVVLRSTNLLKLRVGAMKGLKRGLSVKIIASSSRAFSN
eukprot:1183593-Pyramimonas_sp.AAC.2